ncbi:carboxylesterase 5A-like [Gouania willdenowi]|uniref:Carboxylic ester hydrolase n=1 Tax=Gouania willdenowi TaxID=441366 RepID=A0A8C5NGB0_GOUWI|nr:carboxylesterase 5A-like [Gouania willdenowi]
MELQAKQTFYIFVSMLCVCSTSAEQHEPEVNTRLGALRGLQLSVKGSDSGVHAYLGVPFAKPPVGPSLRLRAPQPVEGWTGVRDAIKQPLMCIQGKKRVAEFFDKYKEISVDLPDMSEDCLYLNIFTPANRAQDAKLPIMVWIHGGGFLIGSASTYDGSALAAHQDVVVVVIQYRLGVLGFLSTGDENMSGNFGMLDQIQALMWIKEHIHNFGGNPDLVTIFGESAGGISASALLLSPLSHGLVHRAIAESGSAAMNFLSAADPLPFTQMVANTSGCNIGSTEKIADCMRNLDLDSIYVIAENEKLMFLVNIDGHFLKKPVMESFENHELLTVPFMTGVNNHEMGWLVTEFFAPPNWTEGLDREQIVNIFHAFYPPEDAFTVELLVEEYFGTDEDRLKNRDIFTEVIGDIVFTIPGIRTANFHRDAGADVYFYEFQYAASILQKHRPDFVRCDHGDEVFIVFGYCLANNNTVTMPGCSKEEEDFSKMVMSYWANFARTGSPNGAGLAHWPKYGAEGDYLKIDLKEQVTARGLKKDQFVFMTETLPEKNKWHEQNKEHVEL